MTSEKEMIERLKAAEAKATPGPWKVGHLAYRMRMVKTGSNKDTGIYADDDTPIGKCADCKECGEPLAVKDDGNGPYHVHPMYPDTAAKYEPDQHQLHSQTTFDLVAGNYEYEEGGIVREDDTAFIAAARTAVPKLLAALDDRDRQIGEQTKKSEFYESHCIKIAKDGEDAIRERDTLKRFAESVGKFTGCNHYEDEDGLQRLVRCLREAIAEKDARIAGLERELAAERAKP